MSVKYQVLSKETAMIGVVKQKKKATGEMIEYHVQMGKAQQKAQEELLEDLDSFLGAMPVYQGVARSKRPV
jgi:hypothetical protein